MMFTSCAYFSTEGRSFKRAKSYASKGDYDKKSCGKLILVLRDHYTQSEIIRWFLKNYAKTDMKFKDYLIWSRKNIKEYE